MNTPATLTSIKINSLDSVDISTTDGKINNAGSITNATANRNAPPQQLHDALTAWHAAQIIAAKQSGSDAAVTAMEPAHTFLASLFAKGTVTPADIAAGAAALADASQTAHQRKLAKAQKAVDEASAALAELRERQTSVTGHLTPQQ